MLKLPNWTAVFAATVLGLIYLVSTPAWARGGGIHSSGSTHIPHTTTSGKSIRHDPTPSASGATSSSRSSRTPLVHKSGNTSSSTRATPGIASNNGRNYIPGATQRTSTPKVTQSQPRSRAKSSTHQLEAKQVGSVPRNIQSRGLKATSSSPYYFSSTDGNNAADELFHTYMWAGYRHVQQGNYNLGLTEFRRALRAKPNDSNALKALQNAQSHMQNAQ